MNAGRASDANRRDAQRPRRRSPLGVPGSICLLSPFAKDGVDQVGLAQTPEALKADLISDHVQVGQRAGLKLGAVEHCHLIVSFVVVRAVGVRPRWTAAGTRSV